MTTRANRIHLAGNFRQEEAPAGAALSPGHLIEIYSNAGVLNVRKHSVKGGNHERYWAIENALEGLRPGATPGGVTADTAYGIGDLVQGVLEEPGSVVSAMLHSGISYAIGDKLISNGDGTLTKASATDSSVVIDQIAGTILEAIDLTVSGSVDSRGVVRVI